MILRTLRSHAHYHHHLHEHETEEIKQRVEHKLATNLQVPIFGLTGELIPFPAAATVLVI